MGQLSGTLFVRGCAPLDPTSPGSHDVPSPLPAYAMDPSFFFAELQLASRLELQSSDPPGVNRLRLRMQTSSPKIERADAFELFIYDLDATGRPPGQRPGERPVRECRSARRRSTSPRCRRGPIRASTVRASLVLNGSCDYPMVAPLLRGYVHFTEIGQQPRRHPGRRFRRHHRRPARPARTRQPRPRARTSPANAERQLPLPHPHRTRRQARSSLRPPDCVRAAA